MQEFFSIEAFIDFFKQLLSFYATPSLETPQYTILRWDRGQQGQRGQHDAAR